jgi:hypothetical protein
MKPAPRGLAAALALGMTAAIAGAAEPYKEEDEIKFDSKHFIDSPLAVGISGTLTGEGIASKNNTYSLWCNKERGECFIASIEQIGRNLMGRLDYAYTYSITKWDAYEVVAVDPLPEENIRFVLLKDDYHHRAQE